MTYAKKKKKKETINRFIRILFPLFSLLETYIMSLFIFILSFAEQVHTFTKINN